MSLKIVTDSACDVPPAVAKELDITVVPVYINIGTKSYMDGIELTRHTFFDQLTTYHPYPTTAAPAAGAFAETYRRLADSGATEILSLHIATSLSNTYNAARLGAAEVDNLPVTLFNTKQISVGAAMLIIYAAEAAAAGDSVQEIVAKLQQRLSHTRLFGLINSLDSLRRSGRVNWAQFGFGTLLKIKPLMLIADGKIEVVAKVRTRKRAIQQLLELVQSFAPFERMAVVHISALDAAIRLQEQAMMLFPEIKSLLIMEIGPAVGTHLGLGAVGFACIAAGD